MTSVYIGDGVRQICVEDDANEHGFHIVHPEKKTIMVDSEGDSLDDHKMRKLTNLMNTI